MLTESLNIYVIDKDGNKVTFPNVQGMQPAIVDVNLNRERMAGAPTNTSTLMYPVCLDSYWTKKEFIEIGSERYYVKQVPTSEKNTEDTRYKHEITFVSERDILENVFFFDCVTQDTPSQISDKPRTNTTDFSFYGDLNELVQRLNDSLSYSKIYDQKGENGFCIVIDDDVEIGEAKEVSMTDAYFATAMQEIYNVFEVPYYWVGKICHVGYQENEITEPFEYGSGNGLISVQKTNAEFRLINRITGQGSADNIPYYYPNTDPNGIPVTEYNNMQESDISGVVPTKIANLVGGIIGKRIYFGEIQKGNGTVLINEQKQYAQKETWQINKDDQDVGYDVVEKDYSPGFEKYEIKFYANIGDKLDLNKAQFKYNVTISSDYNVTCNPIADSGSVLYWGNGVDADIIVKLPDGIKEERITNNDLSYTCVEDGLHTLVIHCNPTYQYINCHVDFPEGKDVVAVEATFAFSLTGSIFLTATEGNVVVCDNVIYPEKKIPFNVSNWGALRLLNISPAFDANKGIVVKELLQGYDYSSCSQFCILDIKKTNIMSKLMPSVYRQTKGAERFYNAKNETYKDDNGNYYSFNNPYVPSEPLEGKQDFEDIKPTINGITNENGELFGEIAAVAFDDTDSDDLSVKDASDPNTNTATPVHPYFYVKLHRFSGVNGFNLFKQGLAQGAMTFNFITGSCAGCSFKVQVSEGKQVDNHYEFKNEVQVDEQGNIVAGDSGDKINASNPIASQQDTMTNSVWVALEKDNSTFGVLMPNATNNYRPKAGDKFVITNILLPTQYITAAEKRLDAALVKYMSENNDEKFTFSIKFSRIYLQEHPEIAEKINENTKLHVKYNNVDYPLFVSSYSRKSDDNILDEISVELSEKLTIAQNKSKEQMDSIMGNVNEQINSAIQDNNNNTTQGVSANDINSLKSLLGNKLSRVSDDTAAGFITFLRGLAAKEEITAEDGIRFGQYINGFLGSGAYIDNRGRAEFESIFSRSFISTPELRYNRIAVTEGEQWCTNGYGIIESVDTEAKTITLHLEENDYASVAVGDLCRGVYNNFGTSEEYQNTTTLDADNCGFPIKAGFFTSYFRVSQILEQSQGKCVFTYELRNDSTPHPCAQMKFAQYGNDIDEARQASAYMSSTGHFYFQSLEKVSTWEISSVNVTIRFGWVDGFPVKLTGGSYQTLKGYGLYAPDNIYFGNAIVQLDPKTVDSLRKDLQQYTIELSSYTDVITVDDAGNVIGGLYKLNDETKHSFRIAPAVFVRKGNDYLIEADAKDDAGEGTFKMYVTPKNCTVEVINGAVCVTAIDNVKDGVAGTKDDVNFDYNAMRAMESISVIVSVNCEGVGSITKTFSVAIKHDSVPYINFSMSNTNTSVSWNTKSSKYIGLPYSFQVFAHKGSDALPAPEVELSEVEGAKITIDNPSTEDGYTLVTIKDLSDVATSTVRATFTASVKYAGVSYESNLVHTINVYQDVNVYDLRPSVTQVVMVTASDGSHTPSVDYVTCRVLCNSSEDEPYYLSEAQMDALSASVKFSKSGDNNLYDYKLSPEEGTHEGVAVTDGMTRITFYLYIGGEVYDTQDVAVMYHGKNGDNGRGISSANTYYAIGDNSETEPDDGLFINDTLSALLIHSNQSKSIWSATKVVYTDKTEALTGKYFVGLAEDLVQIIEGYGLSDSPTEEPDGWWGSYPTVIPQGKYLWACDLIQWVGEVMTEANVRMIGYIGKETPVYYLVSNMTSISVDENGHIPISGQTLDITLKKSIGGDTTDSTDYNIMSYTLKADGSRTIMGSEQGNGSPFKIALPESLTDNITGYYFEVVEGDAIIASLSVLYVKNGASAYEITMSNLNLTYNSRKGNIDGNYPVSRLEVNIQCSKGGTPLKYTNGTADDWVCSTLTENVSDPIIDGVLWSFKVSEDGYTFTYVIYCKTTNKVDVEIPFVVTAGGVQRQYKIHLQSHEDGGTPLNRGIWSSEGYIDENGEATNGYFYRYKGDTLIRDRVAYKIGGIYYYYMVKNFTGDTPVTEAPATAVTTEVPVEIIDEETGETITSTAEEVTYQTSDKWEQMSKVKTIFSEVIYADDATIGGFHANATNLWSGGDTPDKASVSLDGETGEINSRGAEASVRIANGLIEVLNNVGNCNIRFGLKNGYAVLSYYDNNGNLLYDLGPNGIDASDIKASKLEKVTIYCPNNGRGFYSTQYLTSAGKWATEESEGSIAYLVVEKAYNTIWSGGFGSKPTVGTPLTCYRYTAAKINGVYQAEESYGLTQEQAKLCDGLYFTKNVINEGDSLVNYKATGIIGIEYGSSVAGVPMLMGQKYAPKYKILSVSITDGKAMTSTVVSLETNGLIENT